MAYIAEKPPLTLPDNIRRQQIVGWGVDLDPKNRPALPKEKYDPAATGAHWKFPDRQVPTYDRERSPEHKFLTPVFGTVCPPRGISGFIRRYAYSFSEGKLTHWLLLMIADRIDIAGSIVRDVFRGRLPNPVREYGLKAELKGHGLKSRLGQHRYDVKHYPLDLIYFAGIGIAAAATFVALRRAARALW